jgi:hypothetical protein
MTKGVVRLLLGAALLAAFAPTAAAGEIKTESGRLADLIARLASREYVLGAPQYDDRPYVDPSPALHAFRHVASALAWGDVRAAARQAARLDYEVVKFTDAETNKSYYVLREDLSAVEQLRGWGSYIVNPQSRVDALVEVPHPMADAHTPEIGGKIFTECEAKGFLLAGAHRDKADVPDLVDSIFHQVHAAWIGPVAQVTAWQIHGFSSIKHAFPKGAQVVASTGDGRVAPEIANLDAMLEDRGLVSYVFNELPPETKANRRLNDGVPGVTFASLAGAKNEQGRLSRSLGGSFVHVELEGNIRSDRASRDVAGEAIAAVITGAVRRDDPAAEPAPRKTAAASAVEPAASEPIRLAARPAEPSAPSVDEAPPVDLAP